MLSKKQYKAIAKLIYDATFNSGEDAIVLRDELIENLATLFEADNPQFDRSKFFDACTNYEQK